MIVLKGKEKKIFIKENYIVNDVHFNFAGNVKIATPKRYIQIKSLSVGDIVYAWNGKDIVENEIEEIIGLKTTIKTIIINKIIGTSLIIL